jgi:hypothetical protein
LLAAGALLRLPEDAPTMPTPREMRIAKGLVQKERSRDSPVPVKIHWHVIALYPKGICINFFSGWINDFCCPNLSPFHDHQIHNQAHNAICIFETIFFWINLQ